MHGQFQCLRGLKFKKTHNTALSDFAHRILCNTKKIHLYLCWMRYKCQKKHKIYLGIGSQISVGKTTRYPNTVQKSECECCTDSDGFGVQYH